MEKFLIKDPRIGGMFNQYLVSPDYPALWSPFARCGKLFSKAEVDAMAKDWPYLSGCELIGPFNPAPECSPEFMEED
jgi:hypothetical protein